MRNEIHSLEEELCKFLSVKSNVEAYRKIPENISPSVPNFTSGKIQEAELNTLFGVLSASSKPSDESKYSLKSKKKPSESESFFQSKHLMHEPETVATIDTGYNMFEKVQNLRNEGFWTIGQDNTMKLFSISKGSLLNLVITKSGNEPSDIAVTKSGDLVYTDYYYKSVNIVKNKEIKEVIILKNWRPNSICTTSSGDLLVILESDDEKQSKVVRYSNSSYREIQIEHSV
ncbi:uncharacterized protein LOC134237612 [Saccostrea cucullata]|uniref:uncharacterized protein LOC134237612 n=1 Tax=Saccostrea cuccullata TaxID=36930 RepID=UPI002ED33B03